MAHALEDIYSLAAQAKRHQRRRHRKSLYLRVPLRLVRLLIARVHENELVLAVYVQALVHHFREVREFVPRRFFSMKLPLVLRNALQLHRNQLHLVHGLNHCRRLRRLVRVLHGVRVYTNEGDPYHIAVSALSHHRLDLLLGEIFVVDRRHGERFSPFIRRVYRPQRGEVLDPGCHEVIRIDAPHFWIVVLLDRLRPALTIAAETACAKAGSVRVLVGWDLLVQELLLFILAH